MHNLSTFFQFLRHLTTDTVQFIKICQNCDQHTQHDRDPDKADFNISCKVYADCLKFFWFPILPIGAISFHFSISVGEFSVNSVPMYPGLIQFTRTPRFAHSIASDFVSWITPTFDALYAHCGCGTFTICADMGSCIDDGTSAIFQHIFSCCNIR